jgi:two-component system, NarL family, invasion response regulator UvrY
MIKILIADDHPVVREGLKQIISKGTDILVAGEALNGQEVIDKLSTDQFDVVVLDLNIPGRDGFDVLREMRHTHPKVPVLVLSIYPENQVGIRVLRAGASGFMNKDTAPRELIQAIRKIHSGGKYVSSALAEKLAEEVSIQDHDVPHKLLSDREFQVLCMIASGKSIRDIAAELSLSEKTVRTYRDRVFEKMTLKNDVEITHYAIQHNLIEPIGGS